MVVALVGLVGDVLHSPHYWKEEEYSQRTSFCEVSNPIRFVAWVSSSIPRLVAPSVGTPAVESNDGSPRRYSLS